MAAKKGASTKKTTTRTRKVKQPEVIDTPSIDSSVQNVPTKGLNSRKIILILLAILILGAALYYLKGFFVVAMVNNRPITRASLVSELETRYGQETVDSLITEALIFQEANKQGISVDDATIQEEIGKIEENVTSQGQNLDDLLAAQGMTRESLEKQVRIQKLIEALLADRISVSDEEISNYIEENSEFLPEEQDEAEQREQVRQTLTQQKLSSEFQAWITDIKNNANIDYFVKY